MSSDAFEMPSLITAAELAKMVSMSVRSIWRLRSKGEIPRPVRVGGAIRWRLDDVREWYANRCRVSDDRQ